MNEQTKDLDKFYELVPSSPSKSILGTVVSKKRILIGRSPNCDMVISSKNISAIHAVLEVNQGVIKIYDLNSTNGVFVNGNKILVEQIKIGDKVQLADLEFVFNDYHQEDLLPPILDMLTPVGFPLPDEMKRPDAETIPPAPISIPEVKDPNPPEKNVKPKTPPTAPKKIAKNSPRIMYPLAQDPQADFSEYIFEDIDTLYPIFNYDHSLKSVEIIIMNEDNIFSVDYLPIKTGKYFLVGTGKSDRKIEYPYLGKGEKFSFIDIQGGEIFVNRPVGYSQLILTDEYGGLSKEQLKIQSQNESNSFTLHSQDIIRFQHDEIQIFVRYTEAPPKVDKAPLFRRDRVLRGYLIAMVLIVSLFVGVFGFYDVDHELEKEKVPERIATILYKKKKFKPPVKPIPIPDKKQEKPVEKKEIVKKNEVPKESPKPKLEVQKQTNEDKIKAPEKKLADKIVRSIKGQPDKTKQVTKVDKAKGGASKPSTSTKRARFSHSEKTTQGPVDTYKAVNFKATVSSFLAKGGSKFGLKGSTTASNNIGGSGVSGAGTEAEGIQHAKVSENIGTLTGATSGKITGTTSARGLVNKRSVYTAGIPSKTVVLGSMDPDVIRNILRDHIPQFRYCYQKELDQASDEFTGVIKLDFVIGASGHVTKAGVGAESSLPSSVKKCVVNVLRGIKFPEPLGGGTVEVKQPMNFYPVRN